MIAASALRRRATALVSLAVLLAGCVSSDESQRQPEVSDEGFQATGLLDGRRVAISRGEPEVIAGDCDANDGVDRDLCLLVRTIDGISLNVVIENPSALAAGERIAVAPDDCVHCDDIRTHLVVRVRRDGASVPVEGGHVTPTLVGQRIAAAFDLRLPDGDRLTGSFSVRPGSGSS